MKTMKYLMLLLIPILLISCDDREWTEPSQVRNYIRDKHPYCEIEMLKNEEYDWHILVNDTIKNEVWFYMFDAWDITRYRCDKFKNLSYERKN